MPNTKYYLQSTMPIGIIPDNNTKLVLSGTTGEVYQVTGTTGISVHSIIDNIFTWVIAAPTESTTYLGPRLQDEKSVRNVYAYVSSSTSCTINIYHGSIGSTTTLLSSNLVVTTSAVSTTSFTTSLLSGSRWIMLRVVSVADTPGMLTVSIALTPT